MPSAVNRSDHFGQLSPTASEEESKDFIQRRTALFSKVMLLCYVALVGFINVMYAVYPETRPAKALHINIMAAVGSSALAISWATTALGSTRSLRVLAGIDVANMIIIGAAFATSGLLSSDRPANIYSSFIWVSFTVFCRSLVIPSSGQRTILLSALGTLPMMGIAGLVAVDVPRPAFVAGTGLFCLVVITLSALGSRVIYGLRAQVRRAMQLGQYTILEKIGEGGMGTVYKARHALLRRPTAIKLLRSDQAGSSSLKRFEREVQSTAELTHANTIAVYDYGRSPDGLFYYAMEYLDGVNLEQLVVDSGAQPWERVVHILGQVCGSLEEAHSRGLIHQDIKPNNIILSIRGGVPDVIKVLDFGLVRKIGGVNESTTNVVTGTAGFIAPETITDPSAAGPQSDLYAVGAVGYYLLTGELVFNGSTLVETCMLHMHTEPELPSMRTDNEMPAALEQLLLRCLEKDPAARPLSAKKLQLALQDLPMPSPWTEERAGQWWSGFERTPTPPSDDSNAFATLSIAIDSRDGLSGIALPLADADPSNR